jgi:type I restriction enzyme R subunit
VKLIEKQRRKPIYTDFVDELGDEKHVELSVFTHDDVFEKFREKARVFLRAHQDHLAVQKLRLNQPLTKTDIEELERMLIEVGGASPENLRRAKEESHGLGLFVRSLVGLDREAAKQALGAFTAKGTLTSNQVEFVNLIVDQLTEHGVMKPELLYESPFTDVNARGPEGVFEPDKVGELIAVLQQVQRRAEA